MHPHDRPFVSEIPRLKKLIVAKNLVGLANNTKWNELFTFMRESIQFKSKWVPCFRFNCIDSDYISAWDNEWYNHLPYPMLSVMWFEIEYKEDSFKSGSTKIVTIDHSARLESLIKSIGFEYEKGTTSLRIYGYSPIDRSAFE
ncbi:hypothetical protein J3L16_06780 [Alteromonas sp. 5E99-2]|nr:DUF6678 family protein [Alteromonas sp. 5E99-2]MBO1255386.1 hypothetical protein [Alteromonas sp. 5E99-2]